MVSLVNRARTLLARSTAVVSFLPVTTIVNIRLVDHCIQCRQKHKIQHPLKAKDEPVNHLYENPDLNVVPEREVYDQIWLHVKGYDFVPVENYTRFLHKFVESTDSPLEHIAMPPRTWKVATYRPKSEMVQDEYALKKSHRIITVGGLPNNAVSLFIDFVTRHLPAGVELTVTEPNPEELEFRYVPDADIQAMQNEIEYLERK